MNTIKVVRRDKHTGKTHHEIEGQPDKIYLDIRAGLSWPNKLAPAYYCIFGQLDRLNELKRYPIVFFCEGQSADLHELLDKLTDDAKRLLCAGICVDLTRDRECFKDSFIDYCKETETRDLYLIQAPWSEYFSYGLGLIKDWLKKRALVIERGTILTEQLGKIPQNLLENATEPEVDFFAVNALRYALGTFQKYPWQPAELEPIENLFDSRDEYLRWVWR